MRRPHRRWHRRIWPALPLVLGALLIAALALRPAPPAGTGTLVSGSIR